MLRLPRGSLGLCLVGFFASGVAAELPVGDPAAARFAAGTLEGAADHLQQEVASKKIAGGIHLVLHAGKVVHFAVAGVADVEEGGRLEKDALMRIFSMSKPITSVAAMRLWEHGKFRLDDPVARFIPSFADIKVRVTRDGKTQLVPPHRPISVRDLLRHTSGFSYGRDHGDQVLQDHRRAGVLYSGTKNMFPPEMTIAQAADALAQVQEGQDSRQLSVSAAPAGSCGNDGAPVIEFRVPTRRIVDDDGDPFVGQEPVADALDGVGTPDRTSGEVLLGDLLRDEFGGRGGRQAQDPRPRQGSRPPHSSPSRRAMMTFMISFVPA